MTIGVSMVVMPGFPTGGASADEPSYPTAQPSGYVSALPGSAWTVTDDRSSMSAPMPGNEPGTMTFSLGAETVAVDRTLSPRSDSAVTDPTPFPSQYAFPTSVNVDREGIVAPPSVRDCLDEGIDITTAGERKECFTQTATVTFPRPEVDPVFTVGGGTLLTGDSDGPEDHAGCIASWSDLEFAQVNGTDPRPGQVRLLGAAQAHYEGPVASSPPGTWSSATPSFVDNRLSPSAEAFVADQPASCRPRHNAPIASIQVTGLVSSVTFEMPYMVQILKPVDARMEISGWTNLIFGFSFPSADLSIEKTAPAAVDGLGTIDWGLTVANASGSADSHGFVIRDAIPEAVTDPVVVSAPSGCTLSGHDLTCALAPDGYTVTRNASVPTLADLSGGDPTAEVPAVLAAGDSVTIRLRGTAPLSSQDGITNTATVSGVDIDPKTSSNTSTVTTRITPSTWTMAKTATVDGAAPAGGVVQPGDVITYTVTANSTHGPVPGIVMTDDLSSVLDQAAFIPGSARLTVAGGEALALADPTGTTLTTPSFDLEEGQEAVLTYQVRVGENAWSASLLNTVTGTADVPLTSCDPCATSSQTGALVLVQKNGVDDEGNAAPMSGATFEVLGDDDGAPGAAVAGMPVTAVDGQTGRFEIRGLAPGTYWLNETKAPGGHILLAQPAAFSVSATGAIALVNPGADTNVTVVTDVITVGDGKAVALPFTGAAGVGLPVALGGAVLLLAAATALLVRRRTTPHMSRGRHS